MASRKEEKERLRAERLAAQAKGPGSERRRLILGYIVAGLLGAAVIIGLIVVVAGGNNDSSKSGDFSACANGHFQLESGTPPTGTDDKTQVRADCREGTTAPPIEVGDLEASAKAAGCELKLDLPDEGNSHIQPTDPTPKYGTSPPTSGNHATSPYQAADGAYLDFPDPKFTTHSLEHGRIDYQYSPDLSEDEQLAVKGVFDESPDGTLLFPNPQMPYAVAATAWTNMVGCPKYNPQTLDVLRNFRDQFRGNGPESGAFPISF
jgi:uncharacterized protein DUF3105